MKRPEPDISKFKQLNEELGSEKMPWAERSKIISEEFPSVVKLDWKKLFDADPGIMGRIIGDIIKIDQAPPGRPGKRAAVDKTSGAEMYKTISGDGYTVLPFAEVFRILMTGKSLRGMARRIEVSHTHIRDLMSGRSRPSAEEIERISKVMRKSPEFFVEYRMAYIVGMLAERLDRNPDATLGIFQRMKAIVAA